MGDWIEQDLPQATKDLATAKADLDRYGYCLLAEALGADQLAALRTRLEEQALAERQTGDPVSTSSIRTSARSIRCSRRRAGKGALLTQLKPEATSSRNTRSTQ
jgi:hypothetical protein